MVAAMGSDWTLVSTWQLKPPEPFNSKTPDDWPRWRRLWFEQFQTASSLSQDLPAKQISTLLYCLGEDTESVLNSMNVTDEECKVYDTVLTKLGAFFKVRRNVIYERAWFNCRTQQPRETAEQFIMGLYELADNCDYGNLKDEMIHDRSAYKTVTCQNVYSSIPNSL